MFGHEFIGLISLPFLTGSTGPLCMSEPTSFFLTQFSTQAINLHIVNDDLGVQAVSHAGHIFWVSNPQFR